MEEWRSIVGFEGMYEISNIGRARSLPRTLVRNDGVVFRRDGALLRPTPGKNGHLCLSMPGRKTLAIARAVYEAFVGEIPAGFHVDHEDQNPSNNVPGNLRLATRSQNASNSKKPVTNTSGFRGVSWSSDKNMWCAQIKVNQRHIHLGYYKQIIMAAAAYNRAAVDYFGDFAHQNDVKGD